MHRKMSRRINAKMLTSDLSKLGLQVIFPSLFIVHLCFLIYQQHSCIIYFLKTEERGYWSGNEEILCPNANSASHCPLGQVFFPLGFGIFIRNMSGCLVDRKAHEAKDHIYFILEVLQHRLCSVNND